MRGLLTCTAMVEPQALLSKSHGLRGKGAVCERPRQYVGDSSFLFIPASQPGCLQVSWDQAAGSEPLVQPSHCRLSARSTGPRPWAAAGGLPGAACCLWVSARGPQAPGMQCAAMSHGLSAVSQLCFIFNSYISLPWRTVKAEVLSTRNPESKKS